MSKQSLLSDANRTKTKQLNALRKFTAVGNDKSVGFWKGKQTFGIDANRSNIYRDADGFRFEEKWAIRINDG